LRLDDPGASQKVRQVAERAVRRLNVLEYVILAVAAVLALLAGAVAAFLLEAALGFPFRPTWAVASLALFCIPAAVAYLKEKRLDRRGSARLPAGEPDPDQRGDETGRARPTKRS
jgi:uncharacterized membrane protein